MNCIMPSPSTLLSEFESEAVTVAETDNAASDRNSKTDNTESYCFWYLCQFCTRGFRNCEAFIEHKVRDHLQEFIESQNELEREAKRQEQQKHNPIDSDSESSSDVETSLNGETTQSETEYENESDSEVEIKTEIEPPVSPQIPTNENPALSSPKIKLEKPTKPNNFSDAQFLSVKTVTINGKVKYQCRHCPRLLHGKMHFVDHENSHLGLRPYECQFCSKPFSWSNYCKYHEIRCPFNKMNISSTPPPSQTSRAIFPSRLSSFQNKNPEKFAPPPRSEEKGFKTMRRNSVRACKLKKLVKLEPESESEAELEMKHKSRPRSRRLGQLRSTRKVEMTKRLVVGNKNAGKSKKWTGFSKNIVKLKPTPKPSESSRFMQKILGENDEFLYVCTICGKHNKIKFKGVMHYWSHIDYRPLKCPKCGKGFIASSSLRDHEAFHSKIKRYKCRICGRLFQWSSSLSRHKRTGACTRGKSGN